MVRVTPRLLCRIVVLAIFTFVFYICFTRIHLSLSDCEEKLDKEVTKKENVIVNLDKKSINDELNLKKERHKMSPPIQFKMCPAASIFFSSTDIQMSVVHDQIKSGKWNHSSDKTIDSVSIKTKLEVVVIPYFSTNANQIKTVPHNSLQEVHEVLDNMLFYLNKVPNTKFAFSEMNMFESWWSTLTNSSRETLKRLIHNEQLDLVSGAWVHIDEVNSHYYSAITELIEGHEFLINQLNYQPTTHSSLNPFGVSSTMAYIAKSSNLTHSAAFYILPFVKQYLGKMKKLQFSWKQQWMEENDATDIITHVFMPENVELPCGLDPKICCQFDFRQHPETGCDKRAAQPITLKNIIERARVLATQYRNQATTNVLPVLLPVDKNIEQHYENYSKLFTQMNFDSKLNIHARFGTFKDYFKLMDIERAKNPLPTLSGEFNTHLGLDFFKSIPHYRNLKRSLEYYLRGADIYYSLAMRVLKTSDVRWAGVDSYQNLIEARQTLAYLQQNHNDIDMLKNLYFHNYDQKIIGAINSSKAILAQATEYILGFPSEKVPQIHITEAYSLADPSKKTVIKIGDAIIVENGVGHERAETVCIFVESLNVKVQFLLQPIAPAQQIEPILKMTGNELNIETKKYQLCFHIGKLPAFAFLMFELIETKDPTKLAILQTSSKQIVSQRLFRTTLVNGDSVIIKNNLVTAQFDPNSGLLNGIQSKASKGMQSVNLSFVDYDIRQKHDGTNVDSNGFFLEGKGRQLSVENTNFVVIKGPVRQSVTVVPSKQVALLHEVSIVFNSTQLDIRNVIKSVDQKNKAISMRFKTNLTEEVRFFTEINGYQFVRRKRYLSSLLHSNFYPMHSSAFIEGSYRLTLLGREPLAAASLKPGWLEVIFHHNLNQSTFSESNFRLLLEHFHPRASPPEPDAEIGYNSLIASILSAHFQYPPIILTSSINYMIRTEALKFFVGIFKNLPCDVHPVALRTLSHPTVYDANGQRSTRPQTASALVLHRIGVDCRIQRKLPVKCKNVGLNNVVDLNNIFYFSYESAHDASLTLLYTNEDTEINNITLLPMEIKTVKFKV